MGLDAEAMQRYIAAMPSMNGDQDMGVETGSSVDKTGTGEKHTRSRRDRSAKPGPDAVSDDRTGVASKVSPSSPSHVSVSPGPVRKDASRGGNDTSAGEGQEGAAVISIGCDKGEHSDAVVVKQEGGEFKPVVVDSDTGKPSTEGSAPVLYADQDKEVLVLTINKKEPQAEASDVNSPTEAARQKKLKETESSDSGTTDTHIRKRTKADGCKPSLQEVISNLSQGVNLHRDLGDVQSSSSPVSIASLPASNVSQSEEAETEAAKADITQSSWFARDAGREERREEASKLDTSQPAVTCPQLSTAEKPGLPPVAPASIQPAQPKPAATHHKPGRRRARKNQSSPRESVSGDASLSGLSTSPSAPVTAGVTSSSQQTPAVRGAAPAAVVSPLAAAQGPQSVFSVPYSPILPAVYDYSLPDRGLSSATASILAAASSPVGFPSPQPQPTPFMMSYFPLQPMWGGPGTVAIAAAAAAAAASVNVPTPLDLSSPSKENSNGKIPAPSSPQEPLYLGKKDNSGGMKSPGGGTQVVKDAAAQAPSSAKASKRSSHQRSSVKSGTPSSEPGEKVPRHSKSAAALDKQGEATTCKKEVIPSSGKDSSSCGKSPSQQSSGGVPQDGVAASSGRPRYEKNLLLFGDQEVEIMNVGKLRWVVRNEADLLRIAQANLRKWTAPACDSATIILEANSSTENSAGSVAGGCSDRAPDCPVSSSERREDGDQEETTPAAGAVQPATSAASNPPESKTFVVPAASLGKRAGEAELGTASHRKSLKLSNGMDSSAPSKEAGVLRPTASLSLPNFLIDLGAVSEASGLSGRPTANGAAALSPSSIMKSSPLSSLLVPAPSGTSSSVGEPSSLASLLSAPSAGTGTAMMLRTAGSATLVSPNTTTSKSDGSEGKPGAVAASSPAITILPLETETSLPKEYSLLSNMLKSAH